MELLDRKTGREKAAIIIALVAAVFTGQQSCWSRRAVTVAEEERVDAKAAFDAQTRNSEKFFELAKRSADAAKSSADSAEKTFRANGEQFRISERPYISAYVSTSSPPQPLMYKPEPQSVDVKLRLANLGKTPAMKVRFVCEAYSGTGPERKTRFRAFPGVTDFTLGFGEEREVPFLINGMDNNSFGRISTQDTIFIFKGTVKYIDIFKENDATDFCFFYNAGPNPMRGFIECEWSEKGKGEGRNEIR